MSYYIYIYIHHSQYGELSSKLQAKGTKECLHKGWIEGFMTSFVGLPQVCLKSAPRDQLFVDLLFKEFDV